MNKKVSYFDDGSSERGDADAYRADSHAEIFQVLGSSVAGDERPEDLEHLALCAVHVIHALGNRHALELGFVDHLIREVVEVDRGNRFHIVYCPHWISTQPADPDPPPAPPPP